MTDNHTNFKAWYVETLDILYAHEAAGFPILMITFPLLERYLTNKVCSSSSSKYDDLFLIFPELGNTETAKVFWNVYRDSLLHNASLSRPGRSTVPFAWITSDKPNISIEPDGNFLINPVDFSKRVVQTIEADFATFVGDKKLWQPPTVQSNQESNRRSGPTQVGSSNWINRKL